jgi:hypothetical protein
MSLKKIMYHPNNRPKDEGETALAVLETGTVTGTPADIPNPRLEGLKNIIDNLPRGNGASGGGGFSMTDLLGMDSESKGVYDAMVIPIGGQEHDKYRILERCRLTKYETGLYTDAMYVAEHGLGIPGFEGELDRPIPNFGDWIVSKLRATVSEDGQSLEVFEKVAAAWIQRLYQTQADLEKKAKAGIQQ